MNTPIYPQGETEIIHGQIVAKANNYQAVPDGNGGRRMIKSAKVRNYEKLFLKQCRIYSGCMINRPFDLTVTIYYLHGNFDLDNSLKTLLDCLQYAGAITNDNLCKHIDATKKIDRHNPRVEFSITAEPAPPSLFDET